VNREDPYRARVAVPPVQAPASVTLCRSCGIVAPAEGTACEGCNKPLAEVRVQVPAPAPDLTWVAVKCGFTCNQCKFLAPLDGLDADGAVECAHCGLRQRFDVSAWKTGLEFAHAVGDLAGPEPEGKYPHPSVWIGGDNDYAKVGVTHTFVQPKGTVLDLDIRAAPGHPVCKRCRVPLSTTVTGPGAVSTRCPTCGDEARYALPDASRNTHARLVGAVADEHRADRPRANATPTQAGVFSMKCPACGGPLQVQGTDKIQTCGYCKASCFVSAKAMARFNHSTPEPEVWWLLFRGVSEERERLLAATPEDAAAGAKNVIAILKPGAKTDTIGDKPGVYEAPEKPGTHWPQVFLTLGLGTLALLVGYLVLGR
jgi:hypothetical protein